MRPVGRVGGDHPGHVAVVPPRTARDAVAPSTPVEGGAGGRDPGPTVLGAAPCSASGSAPTDTESSARSARTPPTTGAEQRELDEALGRHHGAVAGRSTSATPDRTGRSTTCCRSRHRSSPRNPDLVRRDLAAPCAGASCPPAGTASCRSDVSRPTTPAPCSPRFTASERSTVPSTSWCRPRPPLACRVGDIVGGRARHHEVEGTVERSLAVNLGEQGAGVVGRSTSDRRTVPIPAGGTTHRRTVRPGSRPTRSEFGGTGSVAGSAARRRPSSAVRRGGRARRATAP